MPEMTRISIARLKLVTSQWKVEIQPYPEMTRISIARLKLQVAHLSNG